MFSANATDTFQYNSVINAIDKALLNNKQLGLMLIDLSDFTQINVGLGFPVGDQLIAKFLEKLSMLSCGLFYSHHYYGDKFIVMMPSVTKHRRVEKYANILINYFATNAVEINSLEIPLDIKVSYMIGKPESTGKHILQSLEWTMRGLKEKNTHIEQAKDPSSYEIDSIFKKVTRYSVIRRAMKNGEFKNYYQPIIDLNTGAIRSCETLVRWDNPTLGLMPPSSFLPHISKHHQMINLTLSVVKNLINDFKSIQSELPADFYITVNLPPSLLADTGAVSKIITLIKRMEFPFERIGFELTEQHLVTTQDMMNLMINKLKSHGSKILIDDFGTGYSSIERIAHLPVHGIKVDKQFLLNKEKMELNKTVIRFALDVAKQKSSDVICEGVADEESLNILRELGVPLGQGFLFSKAVTIVDLRRFMSNSAF